MNKIWGISLYFLGYQDHYVVLEYTGEERIKDGIRSGCTLEGWEDIDEICSAVLFLRSIYKDMIESKIAA